MTNSYDMARSTFEADSDATKTVVDGPYGPVAVHLWPSTTVPGALTVQIDAPDGQDLLVTVNELDVHEGVVGHTVVDSEASGPAA